MIVETTIPDEWTLFNKDSVLQPMVKALLRWKMVEFRKRDDGNYDWRRKQ